jgi:hypothetical protein
MMSRTVIVILIYHRHKPLESINLLGSLQRFNVFPVRYGQNGKIVEIILILGWCNLLRLYYNEK